MLSQLVMTIWVFFIANNYVNETVNFKAIKYQCFTNITDYKKTEPGVIYTPLEYRSLMF